MTISFGTVQLSRDIPRVVAVVGAEDSVGKAQEAQKQDADIFELRLDLFPNLETYEGQQTATERIKEIRKFCSLPMIGTVRSREEGGKYPASEQDRSELYFTLMPFSEALDIELNAEEVRDEVAPAANRMGVPVILSYHNFEECPDDDALQAIIEQGFEKGGDVVKVAVTPKNNAELIRLLALTERNADKRICVIAMGDIGRVSRLIFPHFGSRLTYCCIGDDAVAPGQLTVADVRKVMELLK